MKSELLLAVLTISAVGLSWSFLLELRTVSLRFTHSQTGSLTKLYYNWTIETLVVVRVLF